MKPLYLILLLTMLNSPLFSANPVGKWNFSNTEIPEKAAIGKDLIIKGSRTVNYSNELGKNYITMPKGSYYKCLHQLQSNTNNLVNEYSILFDFKIENAGQWYCFYQTNNSNENDGEVFISPNMTIGVAATGYSTKAVKPNNWYRLVITVKNGELFNYYLDEELILAGTTQELDGRYSLNKDTVLFFADDDGEDSDIDISQIQLFDKALSQGEVSSLGKFEHIKYTAILPYLQTPTDSSVNVCWYYNKALIAKVEYGKANSSEKQIAIPDIIGQDSTTYWYSAKLTGLEANTKYSYCCYTNGINSDTCSFYSYPSIEDKSEHLRMVLIGDSQTNASICENTTSAIVSKLRELYGDEYYKYVKLIFHLGDIVGNGNDLESYETEYFKPFSKLSRNIPIMATVGNHELESQFYYNYMKNDQYGEQANKKYYKFNYGPISIFSLNSVIAGDAQLNWFKSKAAIEEHNDKTMFIFSFMHYPGFSEIWPDGNSNWVSSEIHPLLQSFKKSVLKANGHSHCYERGTLLDSGNTYVVTSGGGAGTLDKWGEYQNQTDYKMIQKSLSIHHWILLDVDLQDSSFKAYTYSLGTPDKPLDNVLVDTFSYKINNTKRSAPSIHTTLINDQRQLVLKSNFPINYDSVNCVQVLISKDENVSIDCMDTIICKEDIYNDSGSPDYTPINLNANVKLNELEIFDNLVTNTNYYCKLRFRDINLNWSEYSKISKATSEELGVEPNNSFEVRLESSTDVNSQYLSIQSTNEGNISIRITDLLGRQLFTANNAVITGENRILFDTDYKGFVLISIRCFDGINYYTKVLKTILL